MTTNLLAVTIVTPKVLCAVQVAGTGATTVYTVPALTTTKISHGTICNTSASAVTIDLSIIPSGGSVDGTHKVIKGYSLVANDSLSLKDYIGDAMMGPGDLISIICGTGAVIDVVITGVESA